MLCKLSCFSPEMAAFLLIPGAWHGSWCWAYLTPLLEKAGHSVITPELAPIPPGANPLPLWTRQITELIQNAPAPLILLGHSRGGMVMSEVAAHCPGQIRALIYLSGLLLPEGETMQSTMARPEAGGEPDYLRPARGRCLSVSPTAIIPLFYHLAPLNLAQTAASKLHPEPIGTFSAPSTIRSSQLADIPKFYIECQEDRAIPLALQRAMQAALPCTEVFSLNADHSPFISQPLMLAALLGDITTKLL